MQAEPLDVCLHPADHDRFDRPFRFLQRQEQRTVSRPEPERVVGPLLDGRSEHRDRTEIGDAERCQQVAAVGALPRPPVTVLDDHRRRDRAEHPVPAGGRFRETGHDVKPDLLERPNLGIDDLHVLGDPKALMDQQGRDRPPVVRRRTKPTVLVKGLGDLLHVRVIEPVFGDRDRRFDFAAVPEKYGPGVLKESPQVHQPVGPPVPADPVVFDQQVTLPERGLAVASVERYHNRFRVAFTDRLDQLGDTGRIEVEHEQHRDPVGRVARLHQANPNPRFAGRPLQQRQGPIPNSQESDFSRRIRTRRGVAIVDRRLGRCRSGQGDRGGGEDANA